MTRVHRPDPSALILIVALVLIVAGALLLMSMR